MDAARPADEVEIDLLDLLKQCLIQWRVILIFSLICAFGLSGVKYVRDLRSTKQAAAEALEKADAGKSEAEAEKQLKELEKKAETARLNLSEEEEQAVDGSLTNEEYLLQMDDYMDGSFLMQVDPYNKHVLNLQYYIEGISPEKATILCETYKRQLTSGGYVSKIGAALGCPADTDPRYVRELLDVWYSGASQSDALVAVVPILNISLVLPDDVPGIELQSLDACIASIDESLGALQTGLSESVGPHRIVRISAFDTTDVDLDLRNTITGNKKYITDTQTSLKTAYDAFTDDQKAVYDAGAAALEQEYGKAGQAATENNAAASVSSDAATEVPVAAAKPVFSKKYFAVGFIVGIFLYVCFYIFAVLLRKRIRTAGEICAYLGEPGFGESHAYEGRASNAFLRFVIDKWVFRQIYADELPENKDLAASVAAKISTAAVAKPPRLNKITLLSLEDKSETTARFADEIKTALKEKKADLFAESSTYSIEMLAMNAETIASLGTVVLVGQRAETRINDVRSFVSLVQEFNIDVLGSVFAE